MGQIYLAKIVNSMLSICHDLSTDYSMAVFLIFGVFQCLTLSKTVVTVCFLLTTIPISLLQNLSNHVIIGAFLAHTPENKVMMT